MRLAFLRHESTNALHVLGGGIVELLQAVRRVVELRDDVLEPRRRNVGEVVLELRERAADVVRLVRLGDDVARRVALEELVDSPRVVVADDLERLHSLGLQELRHADDVRLEEIDVEDRRVDALQDVAHARRGLDLVRLVDVAGTVARHVGRVNDAGRLENLLLFVSHFLKTFQRFLITGICAAATDWPRRRKCSSGTMSSISSAVAG